MDSNGHTAIGVDVGGTKIAAGLVALGEGRILARTLLPTLPARGGAAVLSDVLSAVAQLRDEARRLHCAPRCLGVGIPELVDAQGRIVSDATLDWKQRDLRAQFPPELSTRCEADVRCAALAEARFGAGRGRRHFLYVTIGSGISACLVIDGRPYPGAHGLGGATASSPGLLPDSTGRLAAAPALEQYASGPAIHSRFLALRSGFAGDTPEVCRLAAAGDETARTVVDTAARAVGASLGQLVNFVDPEVIILGGGLGLAAGRFRAILEESTREAIWLPSLRSLPILSAATGADAGLIGAAEVAAELVS